MIRLRLSPPPSRLLLLVAAAAALGACGAPPDGLAAAERTAKAYVLARLKDDGSHRALEIPDAAAPLRAAYGLAVEPPKGGAAATARVVERIHMGSGASAELKAFDFDAEFRAAGVSMRNSSVIRVVVEASFPDGRTPERFDVHLRPTGVVAGGVVDGDAAEWRVVPK